jgi:CRISPR-associated endoribonuclease Cas6
MPIAYTVTFHSPRPIGMAPGHEDVHRLACQLMEPPGNPDHHAQDKPYSVGAPQLSDLRPDELELRVNWLRDAPPAPPGMAKALGRQLTLPKLMVEVVAVRKEERSYSAMRQLGPLWACDFRFLSPTYFSRSGRDYALPDPELIIRRLLARWNQHVQNEPHLITDQAARALTSRVILISHEIRTVRISGQNGRGRAGFIGRARLGLRTIDRRTPDGLAAARVFAALSAFAPYNGLGAQTTHGLGATMTLPTHD